MIELDLNEATIYSESVIDELTEEWRPVFGHEKLYEVSSLGNVRGVHRVVLHGRNEKITVKGQPLALSNCQGYLKTTLWKDGVQSSKAVSRLVSEAFIENPESKPCVNHINGNKQDNRVSNLEWCTHSENTQYAYDTGLKKRMTGKLNGRSKEGKVISPSGQVFFFDSRSNFCKLHGLNQGNFNAMLRNERNTCGGWTNHD